jgi:hypothetical protein
VLSLPLDHPEPFAATLGIMHYPGADETERAKAKAFASLWLALPLKDYDEAGHRLPYQDLLRIATEGGRPLEDIEERERAGLATGELLWIYFTLAQTKTRLASWSNAIKVAEIFAARTRQSGSRSFFYDARARFKTVAHLWCAWRVREARPNADPNVPYSGLHTLFELLTDAEYFLRWGQGWRQQHAPLPQDVWQIPEAFKKRLRHWPWREKNSRIPLLPLTDDILAQLRPAGRPRQAG